MSTIVYVPLPRMPTHDMVLFALADSSPQLYVIFVKVYKWMMNAGMYWPLFLLIGCTMFS